MNLIKNETLGGEFQTPCFLSTQHSPFQLSFFPSRSLSNKGPNKSSLPCYQAIKVTQECEYWIARQLELSAFFVVGLADSLVQ